MTEFKFDRMPKYRAWDRERKIMIEVHGLTFPAQPAFLGAVFDGDNDLPWKGRFDVLQYIGAPDRDGTPVCEGDIIEDQGSIYLVKWNEVLSGFSPFINFALDAPNKETMRIIGNVFQNPELLRS